MNEKVFEFILNALFVFIFTTKTVDLVLVRQPTMSTESPLWPATITPTQSPMANLYTIVTEWNTAIRSQNPDLDVGDTIRQALGKMHEVSRNLERPLLSVCDGCKEELSSDEGPSERCAHMLLMNSIEIFRSWSLESHKLHWLEVLLSVLDMADTARRLKNDENVDGLVQNGLSNSPLVQYAFGYSDLLVYLLKWCREGPAIVKLAMEQKGEQLNKPWPLCITGTGDHKQEYVCEEDTPAFVTELFNSVVLTPQPIKELFEFFENGKTQKVIDGKTKYNQIRQQKGQPLVELVSTLPLEHKVFLWIKFLAKNAGKIIPKKLHKPILDFPEGREDSLVALGKIGLQMNDHSVVMLVQFMLLLRKSLYLHPDLNEKHSTWSNRVNAPKLVSNAWAKKVEKIFGIDAETSAHNFFPILIKEIDDPYFFSVLMVISLSKPVPREFIDDLYVKISGWKSIPYASAAVQENILAGIGRETYGDSFGMPSYL